MDQSKVEQVIDRELDSLTKALGLSDWDLSLKYEPIDPGDFLRKSRAIGECVSNPIYDTATIKIDPAIVDSTPELMDVFRHELFHVVLSPFDVYHDYCLAKLESGTVEARQDALVWAQAVERGVIHLERMFKGMLRYKKPKV
jgi:hypothetical protein